MARKGRKLVAWLKALPEVQAVQAAVLAGNRFAIKKNPNRSG
jgi:hypothetical protein